LNFCSGTDLACICYSSGWGYNSQSGPPFRVRITIWFCSLLVALGAGNDVPQAGVWRFTTTTKLGKTPQERQRPSVKKKIKKNKKKKEITTCPLLVF